MEFGGHLLDNGILVNPGRLHPWQHPGALDGAGPSSHVEPHQLLPGQPGCCRPWHGHIQLHSWVRKGVKKCIFYGQFNCKQKEVNMGLELSEMWFNTKSNIIKCLNALLPFLGLFFERLNFSLHVTKLS